MNFHLQKLQAKIRDFWIGPIPVFKTNTGRRLKYRSSTNLLGEILSDTSNNSKVAFYFPMTKVQS